MPFVVIGKVDIDLIKEHFLDGMEPDIATNTGILFFSTATTLEELAVECKIHPSKSQARKNGMHGEIPCGISRQGTKKSPVWVWNNSIKEKGNQNESDV